MSDHTTNFPPRTYSSSFYINALSEGDKTILVSASDEESRDENKKEEKNSPIVDCFIATMCSRTYVVLLMFFGSSMSQTTHSVSTTNSFNATTTQNIRTCFEEKTRRIRTFPSLVDYQANQFSFDPRDPSYQGNIVNFNCSTIYVLTKNAFISLGSNSVAEIDLHNKGLKSVEVGAFKGLFCLGRLDLSKNELAQLSEGSFEGLENLKELDLSHNKLVDIPDGGMVFLNLKNLVVLNLCCNKMKALSKLSFTALYNLETLNVGHNKIKTIDARVFDNLSSLKELRINDNYLVESYAEKWKGLDNLTTLDLSNNYLISFDTSNNYSFSNLKRMNLSGNHLQYLNVYWLRKNFNNLISLDLARNNWYCEDLISIKHYLIDSRIALPNEVNCREIITTSVGTTPAATSTSTSGKIITASPPPNDNAVLVEQNNKILKSNKAIALAIEGLRTFVIVVFIILASCLVIGVGARMGCFKGWPNGVGGVRNRGYLDSNDIESVGLLNR